MLTTKEALDACERIVDLIDDEVSDDAKERAADFFEDVREKVGEVEETIRRTQNVTPKQASALENWEAGVRRWIH